MRKQLSASFMALFSMEALFAQETTADNSVNWHTQPLMQLEKAKHYTPNHAEAKNVILMIGDGMSIGTITASRIYAGQLEGKKGEEHRLYMENLPHVAISKTYSADMQTVDSAAAATAIMTGQKTNNGVLGVSDKVALNNCQSALRNELSTIFEIAAEEGLSVGVVTTTRLTHATPAATYAHSANRNWESIANMPKSALNEGCIDIARQLIEFDYGSGIQVALGGGKSKFTLKQSGGERTDEDLILSWQKRYPNGTFVENKKALLEVDAASTDRLFGLFSDSHMPYVLDKSEMQNVPSLAEMTQKAIAVLSKNPRGYILMVEGGRIDHAHHANLAKKALAETVEFDNAIQAASKVADMDNTLLIVTSDHSQALTLSGYAKRGTPIVGLSDEKDQNGNSYTTLAYTTGPGTGNTLSGELTIDEISDKDYSQKANIPRASGTHSGEDVVISATGASASLFQGFVDDTYTFYAINEALGFRQQEHTTTVH